MSSYIVIIKFWYWYCICFVRLCTFQYHKLFHKSILSAHNLFFSFLLGTYVVIISEVTDPPFLDGRLPDLYVELRVVVPKTSREQSMDKLLRSKSRLKAVSRIS